MSTDVVYRYTGNGRHRAGVPPRDLTARDVAKLAPATLKDVTGGPHPLYVPVRAKATDPPKDPPKTKAAGGAAPEQPATVPQE